MITMTEFFKMFELSFHGEVIIERILSTVQVSVYHRYEDVGGDSPVAMKQNCNEISCKIENSG
jgi:predicted  nucleic acid-binding Zn ribbon protein